MFEELLAALPPNTTWSMDLNMLFNKATEKTVFITSTGSTPSDALIGKFERPIIDNYSQFLTHTQPQNWFGFGLLLNTN